MTAAAVGGWSLRGRLPPCADDVSRAAELNRFLADVEKRAFYMARAAVRDQDDALDIVQDAMHRFAARYAQKPVAEWRPLFFRILQNRITDAHRRSAVRRRVFAVFGLGREDEEIQDPAELAPAPRSLEPGVRAQLDGATEELQEAVALLPRRQQQAFLLRALEGLSVAETAAAMACSQGSVKTHYSRAVHALRAALEEHW